MFDWTQVIMGGIAAVGLVGSTTVPVWLQHRKTRRSVQAVHEEVKTNHGKTAGDYLEMIQKINDNQEALFWLLAELDVRDAKQFERTMHQLDLIRARNLLRDNEHELWRQHFEDREPDDK